MKKVFVSADPLLVGYLCGILEARQIQCFTRNHHLAGAAGELPLNELWPEIWVLDDDDAAAAQRLIEAALAAPEHTDPWTCPGCGERLEGHFGACWRCGSEPGPPG